MCQEELLILQISLCVNMRAPCSLRGINRSIGDSKVITVSIMSNIIDIIASFHITALDLHHILTCSIESNFVLIRMSEQVLGVVESSSFKPLGNIRDPLGYIHNLVHTQKTHTGLMQQKKGMQFYKLNRINHFPEDVSCFCHLIKKRN